ncbi:IS3 family transposase [Bifidobacterium pseudocatenulatum]|uniref:IS3 family transposase n=5 Tax=Bifidobacterium pseudocatenulatum TaxID=28026 RepID=UPI002FD96FFE
MGGNGSRRYDWETKVAAARDHVENGMTKTEVMAKYAIASIAPLERWCREYRAGGPEALRPKPKGRPRGSKSKLRRTGRLSEGEGRVPGKTPGPAGAEVTRRERSAVVRLLAGRGHRLDHLLEIAGLPRSTYYHHLSRPAHVSRPDVEPMVREIWERTPNGCGHRQVRMCLVHEFGTRISAKTVLGVMRRMGLRCAIRSRNPWRRYSSYRGETGDHVHNLLKRDFDAARPFSKLGTDVTEFKVAGGKAYLAPVYDMASKEIVAWDVSRSPDLGQQRRLLAMLAERLPAGAEPILHSDMGWQYQHQWWRDELERLGIRQSMSRKGNCLDNAATEQVFGHLKDEFYRGREFDSYEQFKRELDAYIIHWNTRRRQIRLEGHTPEEFRSMSLAV